MMREPNKNALRFRISTRMWHNLPFTRCQSQIFSFKPLYHHLKQMSFINKSNHFFIYYVLFYFIYEKIYLNKSLSIPISPSDYFKDMISVVGCGSRHYVSYNLLHIYYSMLLLLVNLLTWAFYKLTIISILYLYTIHYFKITCYY